MGKSHDGESRGAISVIAREMSDWRFHGLAGLFVCQLFLAEPMQHESRYTRQ